MSLEHNEIPHPPTYKLEPKQKPGWEGPLNRPEPKPANHKEYPNE